MDGPNNLLLIKDVNALPESFKQYQQRDYLVKFKYDDLTMSEVLTRLLPKELA
jgi:hypothetical protein